MNKKALFFLGVAGLELLWLFVAWAYSEAEFRSHSSLPYVAVLEDGHGYVGLYLLLILTTPICLITGIVFLVTSRKKS